MRPVAASVLAKLRWLDRHEPQLASSSCTVLLGAHDYVVGKLCGKWVTDCTTASTTGLALLHSPGHYATELLDKLDLHHWSPRLAPMVAVNEPCGELLGEAAKSLGAAELAGLPVFHSCGDAGTCSLGCGASVPGRSYAYLGTSGWVAGTFLRDCYHGNKDVLKKARPLGMPPSAGVLTLAHVHENYVFRTGPLSMGEMDELAKSAPLAGRGLLYLPFLAGERCPIEDANLRVALIGCGSSTTRSEVARAVMEGVAMGLRSARDAMLVEGACTLAEAASSPLRVVGGGARSLVWPKYLAAIMGQPVDVLADAQDVGVKGAAMLAGCWLGWHQTLAPEGDWVSVKWRVEPADADVAAYSELHELYLQACAALVPTFAGLANFRASHCP
eukprot:SM000211S06638  [mRNA]  locus=s211:159735:163890:+ [translate_table: standard]